MKGAALVVILLAGALLINGGFYGLILFLMIPVCIGAIAGYWIRPTTALRAAFAGGMAAMIASISLLVLGAEGLICIAMSWPLIVPLGAFGALLMYDAESWRSRSTGAMMLVLLPGSLTSDLRSTPPVYEVRTVIEIAATPEQVWKHVVAFSELPEPQEWYFRAGLAYPIRARINGAGAGAVRYCEFSTGPFVEPIVVWDEPRLLRFRVTENPAPMHEWSPYALVAPKHLHGYLVSKQGQFQLRPLGKNRTLLEGTTWYQHGLWPAQYWRLWSDAIIHRIHLRVLNHIKMLAERGVTPGG